MTSDFVFGLFAIAEITIVIIMTLIIAYLVVTYLANRFRGGQIRKIVRTVPFLRKKIRPDWTVRCRSCGEVMHTQERCARCGLTRNEALDKNVLTYLTANEGALSRTVAASELHVSTIDLNESLVRLSLSGRIVPHPTESAEKYTS